MGLENFTQSKDQDSAVIAIPSWWPRPVRAWFTERLSELAEGPAKKRLYDLATDPRMVDVAKRLARREERDGELTATIEFIGRAWRAPDAWNILKHRHARRRFIAQIPRASKTLRALIERDYRAVVDYLFVFGSGTSQSPDYLEHVVADLQAVEKAVKLGVAFNAIDWFWRVPRKIGYRGADKVFCQLYLLEPQRFAEHFRRPPFEEVAITVPVILRLKEPLEVADVRKLWRRATSKSRGNIPL